MKKQDNKQKEETKAGSNVSCVKLGLDVHAASVTVTVQLDGSAYQPAQRVRTEELCGWVAKLQDRHAGAKVHACYEAGPCGYWLHRRLAGQGVDNRVVAPVALNGRRKTDKRDSRALADQLDRYLRGNPKAFSPVRVPTPGQEQERSMLRHRQRLARTLAKVTQSGRSQMLLQGLRVRGCWWLPGHWRELSAQLPVWLAQELEDLREQALVLKKQLKAADERIAAHGREQAIQPPRGLGALTWLTLQTEVIDWQRFGNRREVASYTGLCPGEHSSGEKRIEGSIDRHGNQRVRHVLIEAVWRLLVWQPGYKPLEKVRQAPSARVKKRAVVAAARRLAIDLWRLATGQTTPEKVGLDAFVPHLRPKIAS
jgi:transposase